MSEQHDNDWLEDALHHDEPYIDDAGFSARVVAALPRRRGLRWARLLIINGAGIMGLLIAWYVAPLQGWLIESLTQLLRARSLADIPLVPVVLIVLCLWPLWGLLRTVIDWRSLLNDLIGRH
ncbi:MAG: hypothetical protein ABSA97_06860 [Verrucomicrobiia bacterium]|jgi:hypothetical protein